MSRELVQNALDSQPGGSALLSLRNKPAEDAMCALQERLASSSHQANDTPETRHKLRSLLVALSKESNAFPSTLFVTTEIADKLTIDRIGHFAYVHTGLYKDEKVAVKMFRVTTGDDMHLELRKQFYREMLLWQQLRNQYILPVLGIDHVAFRNFDCLVYPWMEHGNINDTIHYLQEKRTSIPYARWINEIIQALGYLHSQEVVHGELRGGNIMIDDSLTVRVADFGLSFLHLKAETVGPLTGRAVQWMDPELILSDVPVAPSPTSDIYSFGCVCIEVFSHHPPFFDVQPIQVIMRLMKGARPSRPDGKEGVIMSDDLWKIVEQCLQESSNRPSASELVVSIGKCLPYDGTG